MARNLRNSDTSGRTTLGRVNMPSRQTGAGQPFRLLPILLFVLALLIYWGISSFIHHTGYKATIEKLPPIPDMTAKSAMLKDAIESANAKIKSGASKDPLAGQIGSLGSLYHANDFYDQAIRCYEIAVDLDKKNPRWPYYLASLYLSNGKNAPAEELLDRVSSQLAPEYWQALLKLADAQYKSGKIQKAESNYQNCLSLSHDNPYALLGLARIALDAKQSDKAKGYLERAIKADPSFGSAYRLRAQIHQDAGETHEMQLDSEKAESAGAFRPAPDPWLDELLSFCFIGDELLVYANKAEKRSQEKLALELFQRAVEVDPNNARAHVELGTRMLKADKPEEARKLCEKAIQIDPKLSQAYALLSAILYTVDNNIPAAMEMKKKAIELSPDAEEYRLQDKGDELKQQDRLDEAAELYKKVLQLNPKADNAYSGLGDVYRLQGRIDESVNHYKKALEMNPYNMNATEGLQLLKVKTQGKSDKQP